MGFIGFGVQGSGAWSLGFRGLGFGSLGFRDSPPPPLHESMTSQDAQAPNNARAYNQMATCSRYLASTLYGSFKGL